MQSHRSRRRIIVLILLAVIIPAVILGAWVSRTARQQRLDRALISAIKRRDTEAVIPLLNQGADANARDKPYKPVTLKGQIAELFARLRSRKGAAALADYPTALSLTYGAVQYYPPDTSIIVLINSQGDPSEENVQRIPNDPFKIVSALFDRGARLGPDESSGSNLLANACMCDHAKTVALLLEHHANPNEIHPLFADSAYCPLMCTDKYDCIRLLLEHGANVNARDLLGRTRLMFVRDTKVYPLLYKYGVDPNIQDSRGQTALIRLFESMYLPDSNIRYGTRFLLEHGAKASIKDKTGHTALDYAKGPKSNFMSSARLTPAFDAESIRLLEAAMKRERKQSLMAQQAPPLP